MTRGSDRLEYAPLGLIGVLTPQANTTVEPELAILCPPGHAIVNARLTSPKGTIEERLIDYIEGIDRQIDQFANAPLAALAIATTGVSYLAGRDAEDALVDRVTTERSVPLVTAARAVCDALSTLGARRIALVSPYPAGLTDDSVRYWTSRGFHVTEVVSVFEDIGAFHPIYALSADAADGALRSLDGAEHDAVVMLGTGMPTLAPIERAAGRPGPPVLSCVLALAWRSVVAASGGSPDATTLEEWVSAKRWRDRLRASRGR
ncbi:MAG: hypothetical protein HQ481_09985 [Alphaproteobacteria bacterium]|nr:hypothetical protein [Alphaproteobacteria bacterium]